MSTSCNEISSFSFHRNPSNTRINSLSQNMNFPAQLNGMKMNPEPQPEQTLNILYMHSLSFLTIITVLSLHLDRFPIKQE